MDWNGFEIEEFEFEGMNAKVVVPKNPNGKWMLKTEYFGAFPALEIELIKKGYHLCFIKNSTRWCVDEDLFRKERFCNFVVEKYNLCQKCVIVGMSCGGMIGVKFAALYPERVAVFYADAPVMNLLSCPYCLGDATDTSMIEEYENATGRTLKDTISYRNHPIDNMHALLENKIPVLLVCGDSDNIVPYEENGKLLYDYYTENGGDIKLILKPGIGHHPHGHTDSDILIDYIEMHNK